jgi:hypothetical protein
MTVLMYAVLDAGDAPVSGHGLQGRRLREVGHGNLRAVLSDHDQSPPADEATLWAYGNVVDQLMAAGALLPARFGTTAPADRDIRAMLAERRAELSDGLDRVRGAVEFAVHAPAETSVPAPRAKPPTTAAPNHAAQDDRATQDDAPGTAYLRRRLAQVQRAHELARQVNAVAGELIRDCSQRPRQALACLVDRGHAEAFTQATRAVGLTVTGPWPPYSFVEARS